jgi:hypothetical protein
MAGYTKIEKQADGSYKRVPADMTQMIADKEARLLAMYEELEALKAANS